MPAAQVRLPGTGVAKDGQKHLSLHSEDPTVLLGDEMIDLALGKASRHVALIFVGLINEILLSCD